MLLHIVRHGQTHWNVERRIQGQLDSELDELGIKQASERGKDFTDVQFSAVYSSSSLRTRQTTGHLLGNLANSQNGTQKAGDQKIAVSYMDELREVCWGIWEGRLWSEIEAAYPDMVEAHHKATDDFNVAGAESSYQTQERGVNAIESIITQHQTTLKANDNNELLVVSHGAIMKKILAFYLDIPLTSLHALPSLPNCAHCIIEVAGQKRNVVQIASLPTADTEWPKWSGLSAPSE